ncbi:MAG: hypothetical protein HY231_18840 [Acidobacteria bacterium]|nr:hypothetical protein [Acidobacteriota bacterium]
MTKTTIADLRASVQDRSAFYNLNDYFILGNSFLSFLQQASLTRIISPSQSNYIFYQYDHDANHRITRPLNKDLFLESPHDFESARENFLDFLNDLRRYNERAATLKKNRKYLASKEINKVIYTMQQSIGSIGDSFDNSNQSRKRIGQLFENLVKLVLKEMGLECEPRTISIPIPDYEGYRMPYELDLVFSRDKAILTTETEYIHQSEIVGSVKTTSKDRIDKIFLDKFLLTKLLERKVPVIAIFLHDVQRAQRGNSIFGIASTFKSNHFLGYTVALNKLDGVYYVDPRPEMTVNERLREQIHDFQQLLVKDLWTLSSR